MASVQAALALTRSTPARSHAAVTNPEQSYTNVPAG